MPPSSKRLLYIDFAKAIAIVLVVIGHYFPENYPSWYADLRSVIYGFHMPLFMFSSGYLYIATKRQEKYGHFLLRKVQRLLVPYFVVSVLIVTLKLVTQGDVYVEHPVTILSYVRILYLPEAGYFTWFVWALWWMFVIVPFFNTERKRLLLLFVSAIIFYIPVSLPEVFCLMKVKQMLVFFCLGCIVWDWKKKLNWIKYIPVYALGVLFVGINYLYFARYINHLDGASLIVALVGICFVASVSKWVEKKGNVTLRNCLLVVSSSSYIIYLLHTTFEGVAKAGIHVIPILMDAQNYIMFSLGALLVISFGVITPILLDIFVLRRFSVTRILFGYN